MDRRLGGFLMVIIALVAVLTLPGLAGRKLAGSAVVQPPPGPPGVGDCVVLHDDGSAMSTSADDIPYAVPSADAVPCPAHHDAEIVSYLRAPATLGPVISATAASERCAIQTQQYLGLPADAKSQAWAHFQPWTPTAGGSAELVRPTSRQSAAGQSWLACAITSIDRSLYLGSVRGVFSHGTMPDSFGECALQLFPLWGRIVSCDLEHVAEIVGMTGISRPTTQRALDASCSALVHRITGMADPTAGGKLQVLALVEHFSPTSGTVRAGLPTDFLTQKAQAACVVAASGDRTLARSLFGLGNHAVPWGS